ncbi:MAG: hypothetical protein WBC77_04985 [Candidatus Zixiibacteriota bacterium]|jgi:hypothetical protein
MKQSADVEEIEKSTVVLPALEKSTATQCGDDPERPRRSSRLGAGQYYEWLRSGVDEDRYPSLFPGVVLSLYLVLGGKGSQKYLVSSPLRTLARSGQSKPLLSGEQSLDAVKRLSDIVLTQNQLLGVQYEEDAAPIFEPPHDFVVEGLQIDWKCAFEQHRRLNELRARHGIRRV